MSPRAFGTSLLDPAAQPVLELVNGTGKGKVYELAQSKLTIGRSDDNDIVIQSEAVSRYHAYLEQSSEGYVIFDNKSKNGVLVNGTQVESCPLQAGDVVQVGNFTFRFHATGAMESVDGRAEAPADSEHYGEAVEAPPAKPKVNRRVIIYVVVGLILAYVVMNGRGGGDDNKDAEGDKTKKTDVAKEDAKEPQPPLGTLAPKVGSEDPTLTHAEQDLQKLDMSNPNIREAEQFFRKGQREYMNHNYSRAIDGFQAALAIYRGHELAQYYLGRSVFEAEGLAKKNQEIGRKYFDSLQYQRAIYHFNEVIALMAHRPTDPMVGQAEKYISICKQKLQASELYP